jgi:transcriptional antiterminator NusG
MRLSDDSWYVVRNTPGVTGFVGMGSRPTPLEQDEVKKILKQMEEEAPKVNVNYQVGQAVKINDGPFTDFEGVVDAIDQERGRVRVMVSFFGRDMPVELDFLQVTRLVD